MSKKNKDIEVTINEYTENRSGEKVGVHELTVGKRQIGKIEEHSDKKIVILANKKQQIVKSLEDGYEFIIRSWNLHEQ